jgi:hypothetical protein
MSMKPRFTPWVLVLGLLLLAEIGSIFGIVPISSMDIFWLVVTVACIWAIMKFLLPKKEAPKK